MGQEQSSNLQQLRSSRPSSHSDGGGVQLVHGSGAAVGSRAPKSRVAHLLEQSTSLRLPQQLLPPPAVKDDVSSALQGAQMMHELRSVLGGLLLGVEESPVSRAGASRESKPKPAGEAEALDTAVPLGRPADAAEGVVRSEQGRRASSIEEMPNFSVVDTRAEQDHWARLGIDQATVNAMLEEVTGGVHLTSVLDRQAQLMALVLALRDKSIGLREAMDRNTEEARRTTVALERLDHINVALTDVQDNLESAVATANILGASHFAHDDEMCSFKNFLKRNPPSVP